MWISDNQYNAVITLTPAIRYSYFIKMVADQAQAWVLRDMEWATSRVDAGTICLLLWPAERFAKECAIGQWTLYVPCSIEVHSLLDMVLPDLRRRGVLLAVFPTPAANAAFPSLDQFESDLREELENIE